MSSNISDLTPPTTNFDDNWSLMRKTDPTESVNSRVNKVSNMMKVFLKCGCVCSPDSDPINMHNTKRASINRRAKAISMT